MTYIADLDPNNPARLRREAHEEMWDLTCPEWRLLSLDPEDRPVVAESDVEDPDAVFTRYGSDDPGRHDRRDCMLCD